MGADGAFVAANNRVSQSVPHLHVHVVPRRPQGRAPRVLLATDDLPRRAPHGGGRGGVARRVRLARRLTAAHHEITTRSPPDHHQISIRRPVSSRAPSPSAVGLAHRDPSCRGREGDGVDHVVGRGAPEGPRAVPRGLERGDPRRSSLAGALRPRTRERPSAGRTPARDAPRGRGADARGRCSRPPRGSWAPGSRSASTGRGRRWRGWQRAPPGRSPPRAPHEGERGTPRSGVAPTVPGPRSRRSAAPTPAARSACRAQPRRVDPHPRRRRPPRAARPASRRPPCRRSCRRGRRPTLRGSRRCRRPGPIEWGRGSRPPVASPPWPAISSRARCRTSTASSTSATSWGRCCPRTSAPGRCGHRATTCCSSARPTSTAPPPSWPRAAPTRTSPPSAPSSTRCRPSSARASGCRGTGSAGRRARRTTSSPSTSPACSPTPGCIEVRVTRQVYSVDDGRFLPDRYVVGTCPNCGYELARGDQCENCTQAARPHRPDRAAVGDLGLDEPRDPRVGPPLPAAVQAGGPTPRSGSTSASTGRTSSTSIARKWLDEGLGRPRHHPRPGVGRPGAAPTTSPSSPARCSTSGSTRRSATSPRPRSGPTPTPDAARLAGVVADRRGRRRRHATPSSWRRTTSPSTRCRSRRRSSARASRGSWSTALKGFNWLNYYGGKFSTSQGRGVFMDDALDLLPADYWRWYLMANAPESDDTSFTWQLFGDAVNKDLVGTLGNFVNRTTTQVVAALRRGGARGRGARRRRAGARHTGAGSAVASTSAASTDSSSGSPTAALRALWAEGNAYLEAREPWRAIKVDRDLAAMTLRTALGLVAIDAIASAPFIPTAAETLAAVCPGVCDGRLARAPTSPTWCSGWSPVDRWCRRACCSGSWLRRTWRPGRPVSAARPAVA